MSTAIILTGQMRTYLQNVFNHRHYLYRWYPDADFFISTINDRNTSTINILKQFYPNASISVDVVGNQPEFEEPEEVMRFEGTVRSCSIQNIFKQFWQNKRGWELCKNTNKKYDQIIRVRPDSFFHTFTKPDKVPASNEVMVPWWGKCGGLNDRFAVMGYEAAENYFNILDNVKYMLSIGAPLQPEALTLFNLQLNECEITQRLKTEFSTTCWQDERMDCNWPIFGNVDNRDVVIRFPEIRLEDVAYLNL